MKRFRSFQAEAFLSDRKRVFRMIEIPLSVVLAVIALFFYLNRDVVRYDATMYGTLVSAEGEVLDEFDFDIGVVVRPPKRGWQKLTYELVMPKDFPYLMMQGEDLYHYPNEYINFYLTSCWCYGIEDNNLVDITLLLNVDEGHFVVEFEDESKYYLIASEDPNAKLEDIMKTFDLYWRGKREEISIEDLLGDIKIDMKSEYDE